MLEVLLGIIVGLSMVVVTSRQRISGRLYSASLISLPIIYVGFGILTQDTSVILHELVYGLPFIFVGILCLLNNFSYYPVAIFWLIHGGYDLYHDTFLINGGVPGWYPVWCAVVDLVVGIWLLYLAFTQAKA
ncbi:MAG: hypothetical protein AAFQ80_07145 [Cyanobacteria bacterium J06621_8]